MPNQTNDQQKSKKPQKPPFPTTPKALEHRISMKWLTLEALTKVNKLQAVDGPESRVMLLTSLGQVEGYLKPIAPSLAESYREVNGELRPDYASMVTHLRTDLLTMYEEEDSQGPVGQSSQSQGQSKGNENTGAAEQGEQSQQQSQQSDGGSSMLQLVDSAPILSLTDVVLRAGGQTTQLPQLTLFADQVIGFTLLEQQQLHGSASH